MQATHKIIAENNQTWMDIALQEYGSIEGIKYLVDDNPHLVGSSVMLHLKGQELSIRTDMAINKKVVNHYSKNEIKPATNIRFIS